MNSFIVHEENNTSKEIPHLTHTALPAQSERRNRYKLWLRFINHVVEHSYTTVHALSRSLYVPWSY